MQELIIRRIKQEDAPSVVDIIIRNFLEINSKDYGLECMKKLAATYNNEKIYNLANRSNMYVIAKDDEIIGTGAIANYYAKKDEAIILSVFVKPEYHNQGIGTKIINTLENDEIALNSKRIEIPASITSTGFYLKFGYNYKNGIMKLDKEKHYRLEKYFDI